MVARGGIEQSNHRHADFQAPATEGGRNRAQPNMLFSMTSNSRGGSARSGQVPCKSPSIGPASQSTRSPVVPNWLPQSGPLAAPPDELVDALFKAEAVKRTSFELGFERGAHPGSASFRRKLDGVTLPQAEHAIPVGHSLRDAARALTSLAL
jgi:hypothetical protein